MNQPIASTAVRSDALAVNKLIRNTYILLSMTLLFSAVMAMVSLALHVSPGVSLICMFGALGLIWFALPKTANSSTGLWVVFAITGLLGFSLGPTLAHYLSLAKGPSIVATAMAGTGIIFFALSGYALVTRRDFSFLGGFLFVGFMVVLAAALANIFLYIPALSLAISAAVIMIMSGFILFDTSRMLHHAHTTNYVYMTVSLYLNIFNIFIHLLNLLGVASDD